MNKRKPTNQARFSYIKNLLAQDGATISSVARQAKASWDTVRNISRAGSFGEYKGVSEETKTPSEVSLKPVSLAEQLKAQKARINEHFDAVIGAIEQFKL